MKTYKKMSLLVLGVISATSLPISLASCKKDNSKQIEIDKNLLSIKIDIPDKEKMEALEITFTNISEKADVNNLPKNHKIRYTLVNYPKDGNLEVTFRLEKDELKSKERTITITGFKSAIIQPESTKPGNEGSKTPEGGEPEHTPNPSQPAQPGETARPQDGQSGSNSSETETITEEEIIKNIKVHYKLTDTDKEKEEKKKVLAQDVKLEDMKFEGETEQYKAKISKMTATKKGGTVKIEYEILKDGVSVKTKSFYMNGFKKKKLDKDLVIYPVQEAPQNDATEPSNKLPEAGQGDSNSNANNAEQKKEYREPSLLQPSRDKKLFVIDDNANKQKISELLASKDSISIISGEIKSGTKNGTLIEGLTFVQSVDKSKVHTHGNNTQNIGNKEFTKNKKGVKVEKIAENQFKFIWNLYLSNGKFDDEQFEQIIDLSEPGSTSNSKVEPGESSNTTDVVTPTQPAPGKQDSEISPTPQPAPGTSSETSPAVTPKPEEGSQKPPTSGGDNMPSDEPMKPAPETEVKKYKVQELYELSKAQKLLTLDQKADKESIKSILDKIIAKTQAPGSVIVLKGILQTKARKGEKINGLTAHEKVSSNSNETVGWTWYSKKGAPLSNKGILVEKIKENQYKFSWVLILENGEKDTEVFTQTIDF
ncbi:hypothetical protein JS510_00960 [Mycoplasma tauri]|uniref:hypothetical protein n=1 Tax=Mycoplasma tauri TaxID=547987 RepID=UPI00196730F1|nr:hypothetical protein [Mycoplasma tauri]QSB07677.1 hypothetical protein JS510_00960 [Mycoplasma tauri]